MSLADEPGLSIVFNGEIYNFRELRRELPDCRTMTDTEVLLRGYRSHGSAFFKKIRGIYAFAILDLRDDPKLLLLRDPSGVKPLYWSASSEDFLFASEIKSLRPLCKGRWNVNQKSIMTYLSIGYCPEPATAYAEISALEPGVLMRVSLLDYQAKHEVILKYSFTSQSDHEDQLARTESLLRTAVARNVVADVPVFFSLSGGIDSTLILAYAAKQALNPKSITVSFDDKTYDESAVAKRYMEALHSDGEFINCETSGSLGLLKKILKHFDQPYADSSMIPFYYLTSTSARYGKVLIGGDGGDEIHAGYSNFRMIPLIHGLRWASPGLSLLEAFSSGERKRQLSKVTSLCKARSVDELIFRKESWIYPDLKLGGHLPFRFDPDEALSHYVSCFPSSPDESLSVKITKDAFLRRMLGDYLRKADMMSMINSVEYRVPMLDEDLVMYSLALPLAKKTGMTRGKKILRNLHGQIFSADTSRRPKTGFSVPLDKWLPESDFDQIRQSLLESKHLVGYVNLKYVAKLCDALRNRTTHEISRAGVYQQILIFFALHYWMEEGFASE